MSAKPLHNSELVPPSILVDALISVRPQYKKISPTAVQLGCLLEVQVGFCVVPIQHGKFKLLLKLRSICVLDRSVENVSVSIVRETQRLIRGRI